MKLKIKIEDIINDLVGEGEDFPKYTTQIMNLANQNAQGTRPRVVGQMSDLIQEFTGQKQEEWAKWYKEKMPNAIEEATNRIYGMVQNLKKAIELIDKDLVRKFVEDLILVKTYVGLRFQESILKRVAAIKNQPYRLAEPSEEKRGIDGYIGDMPISIKPITYKTKNALPEDIKVNIIYYDKLKDGIVINFDF